MKIYLVGGAVRDKLLGLPVKDYDWVVTGATPAVMKQQGYIPVGKDFPVFLHPETREEYALARTERKSGVGYGGFVFHTSPDVSITDDLIRRDLTINAIAEDSDGHLIDPYGGQQDLEHKILRHVSPAFQEDPLRILRVARFSARLSLQGFVIANETMALMHRMVHNNEASHLVAERVWQETVRALMASSPHVYFETLLSCDALPVVLPELHLFISDSDNLSYVQSAAEQHATDVVRFGCLFANRPEHHAVVQAMAKRMKLPSVFAEMASLVVKLSAKIPDTLNDRSPKRWMTLFEQADALRRPERFSELLECTRFISAGRLSHKITAEVNAALREIIKINAREIVARGVKGKDVGEQLRQQRLSHLNGLLNS